MKIIKIEFERKKKHNNFLKIYKLKKWNFSFENIPNKNSFHYIIKKNTFHKLF
jgi:hypothetical protein